MKDDEILFRDRQINLSCEAMQEMLHGVGPEGVAGCVLLDVREEWEHRFVRFPDSLHIPLSRLPGQLDRIPRDRPVIVYCHTGIRSLLACYLLSENGFVSIKNLEGGIDAFSVKIDPRLPRYFLEPGRRPPSSVLEANEKASDLSNYPWGDGVKETMD